MSCPRSARLGGPSAWHLTRGDKTPRTFITITNRRSPLTFLTQQSLEIPPFLPCASPHRLHQSASGLQQSLCGPSLTCTRVTTVVKSRWKLNHPELRVKVPSSSKPLVPAAAPSAQAPSLHGPCETCDHGEPRPWGLQLRILETGKNHRDGHGVSFEPRMPPRTHRRR